MLLLEFVQLVNRTTFGPTAPVETIIEASTSRGYEIILDDTTVTITKGPNTVTVPITNVSGYRLAE